MDITQVPVASEFGNDTAVYSLFVERLKISSCKIISRVIERIVPIS